jgi:hypothetical protein
MIPPLQSEVLDGLGFLTYASRLPIFDLLNLYARICANFAREFAAGPADLGPAYQASGAVGRVPRQQASSWLVCTRWHALQEWPTVTML